MYLKALKTKLKIIKLMVL